MNCLSDLQLRFIRVQAIFVIGKYHCSGSIQSMVSSNQIKQWIQPAEAKNGKFSLLHQLFGSPNVHLRYFEFTIKTSEIMQLRDSIWKVVKQIVKLRFVNYVIMGFVIEKYIRRRKCSKQKWKIICGIMVFLSKPTRFLRYP